MEEAGSGYDISCYYILHYTHRPQSKIMQAPKILSHYQILPLILCCVFMYTFCCQVFITVKTLARLRKLLIY